MTVAHLGSALGRQGGPSGYVAQVKRALEQHGAGAHHVLFPPSAKEHPPAATATGAMRSWLRRARLTWGSTPDYARPAEAELQRVGGQLDRMIADVWAQVGGDAAPSIDQAAGHRAAVLFAHDVPVAEQALQRREPGQQVWLFLHSPMPLALYLAWCWGVPDRRWEEVRTFPDVQAWMSRELRVIGAVDKVWLPCREAADEWSRIYSRFEAALGRAEYLLTGAAGPLRAWPSAGRAALRSRWGLPGGAPVALFLGNNQAYRGLDLLMRAFDHLPSARDVPGVVAVAGMREDALPLHPRLKALGRVRDVTDLLAAVDLMINVNRFSLFDLSIIEALEAGLPLVLSRVGGNRTFKDLGAGCLMFDELTPAAVAVGLVDAFRMSDRDREPLQRRSHACYAAHLTLRHLRDRHVAAYDAAPSAVPA